MNCFDVARRSFSSRVAWMSSEVWASRASFERSGWMSGDRQHQWGEG